MKALITGAGGFAGTHLARFLLACGDELMTCSRSEQWPDFAADLQSLPLWDWDITTQPPDAFAAAVQAFSPDVVYHLAALSNPAECGQTQPTDAAMAINVGGTKRVIELCSTLPTPPLMLLVSSSKVYARDEMLVPQSEEADLHPRNGYDISKLLAEKETVTAVSEGKLTAVIARAFQHSGPGQMANMLLPEWTTQFAQRRDPVNVISPNVGLDLSDVRDVVAAYRLLAEAFAPGRVARPGKTPEVFNVGSGQVVTGEELWKLLCEVSGYEPACAASNPKQFYEPIADSTKLRSLGWRPRVPLQQTVSDVFQFWKQTADS